LKAVILAGGSGSRLKDFTEVIPIFWNRYSMKKDAGAKI